MNPFDTNRCLSLIWDAKHLATRRAMDAATACFGPVCCVNEAERARYAALSPAERYAEDVPF